MDTDVFALFTRVPFIAAAVVAFIVLRLAYKHIWSDPKCPPGLVYPPSPPGARLIGGHSHIWALNVSNRPHETQLVKWAREYGEIYQFRLGSERWVVLSSQEAVRVSTASIDIELDRKLTFALGGL